MSYLENNFVCTNSANHLLSSPLGRPIPKSQEAYSSRAPRSKESAEIPCWGNWTQGVQGTLTNRNLRGQGLKLTCDELLYFFLNHQLNHQSLICSLIGSLSKSNMKNTHSSHWFWQCQKKGKKRLKGQRFQSPVPVGKLSISFGGGFIALTLGDFSLLGHCSFVETQLSGREVPDLRCPSLHLNLPPLVRRRRSRSGSAGAPAEWCAAWAAVVCVCIRSASGWSESAGYPARTPASPPSPLCPLSAAHRPPRSRPASPPSSGSRGPSPPGPSWRLDTQSLPPSSHPWRGRRGQSSPSCECWPFVGSPFYYLVTKTKDMIIDLRKSPPLSAAIKGADIELADHHKNQAIAV